MIVISGALVLVALVLLVIGVVDPSLPFVYASIAVSLVSLVFLVIGILQRRGEPVPAAASAEDGADAPASVKITKDAAATQAIPVTAAPAGQDELDEEYDEELETGGTVLVVAGRPRYHVEGCRYLTGKDAEALDVLDAREEGFTACGVCKPDEALADVPAALDMAENEAEVEPEAVEDEPAAVPLPSRRAAATKATAARAGRGTAAVGAAASAPVQAGPAKKGPAHKAPTAAVPAKTAPVKTAPAKPAPAKKAPAAKAPASKAAAAKGTRAVPDPLEEVAAGRGAKASTSSPTKAGRAPARKAPATSPAKAPAAAAAEAPPAAPAATRRTAGVVVIPDRGRFHKDDCRYVRGVEGAEVLTRAQATKQGFEACGVCKP